jgi:GxxExxY protein
MNENEIARQVIGLAIDRHRLLGPGLLESAYKKCLCYQMARSGLVVEKEKPVPLTFDSVYLEYGYRIDLLVERKLVIEIKSVDCLHPVHLAQILTYLKLGDYRLGLLVNFNVPVLKDGIKRVINGNLNF